jgi:glycosyltransferase involved in cell wall biosynthesis
MKVAWFPKSENLVRNPYWERLQATLQALGVEFETSHDSYWTQRRWLLANRGHIQVLHFHFIQPHYIANEDRASLRRLFKFTADLLLARMLGYRIVWTVHDLMPTWPKEPQWVERLARYIIAWLAHDVIVHCQEAKRLLAQRLRRGWRVHVLPLPSYTGMHPNNISAAVARQRLQIEPDRFVVAFVGGIRPNKGLEELIDAFSQFDDPRAVLLIAGRPWPPNNYIEQIKSMSKDDNRIVLRAQEVPDEEMQVYINAADVLVFPFKWVLTSSSVILAMSFGRPVIVPGLGCLTELVKPDVGFIYKPGDVINLVSTIEKASAADLTTMGASAARQVNAYNWRDLALCTLEVYGNE